MGGRCGRPGWRPAGSAKINVHACMVAHAATDTRNLPAGDVTAKMTVEYANMPTHTNMLFQLRPCFGLWGQQIQLKTSKQSLRAELLTLRTSCCS